jgi:uncharacterized membrane protein
MSLAQRLLRIDTTLGILNNEAFNIEYARLFEFTGTKFYLKLNMFEKKVGL